MSWAYRIVSHPAVDEDGVSHDIREVYFDTEGAVTGVAASSASFVHFESDGGDCRQSLQRQLARALEAMTAPIVPMPEDASTDRNPTRGADA